MVALVGASATICREPGQARKGAAAAADLGAGVSLAGVTPILLRPASQKPPVFHLILFFNVSFPTYLFSSRRQS